MKEKKFFNANDGEYILSESSESTLFYDVLALSRMDKKVIKISDDELRLITSKLYCNHNQVYYKIIMLVR